MACSLPLSLLDSSTVWTPGAASHNGNYDLLASVWASPIIADGKVYIGDEDGDVAVFRLSADPKIAIRPLFHPRVTLWTTPLTKRQ